MPCVSGNCTSTQNWEYGNLNMLIFISLAIRKCSRLVLMFSKSFFEVVNYRWRPVIAFIYFTAILYIHFNNYNPVLWRDFQKEILWQTNSFFISELLFRSFLHPRQYLNISVVVVVVVYKRYILFIFKILQTYILFWGQYLISLLDGFCVYIHFKSSFLFFFFY